jgi:hypothetical protein
MAPSVGTPVTAEEAIRDLNERTPAAMRLAEAASLAIEIEPTLLRRLRRGVVPEASPLVESLLWSSDLASSRTAASLVLRSDAVVLLRDRLRADQPRLDLARAIVEEAHQASPQILRCEEELAYLGLVDLGRHPRSHLTEQELGSRIRTRLGQVIGSIQRFEERRGELLAWSTRAMRALPDRVQSENGALFLSALSSGSQLLRSGAPWAETFPRGTRDVQIKVLWTSSGHSLQAARVEQRVGQEPGQQFTARGKPNEREVLVDVRVAEAVGGASAT